MCSSSIEAAERMYVELYHLNSLVGCFQISHWQMFYEPGSEEVVHAECFVDYFYGLPCRAAAFPDCVKKLWRWGAGAQHDLGEKWAEEKGFDVVVSYVLTREYGGGRFA
jgi:hypothetical protein